MLKITIEYGNTGTFMMFEDELISDGYEYILSKVQRAIEILSERSPNETQSDMQKLV